MIQIMSQVFYILIQFLVDKTNHLSFIVIRIINSAHIFLNFIKPVVQDSSVVKKIYWRESDLHLLFQQYFMIMTTIIRCTKDKQVQSQEDTPPILACSLVVRKITFKSA